MRRFDNQSARLATGLCYQTRNEVQSMPGSLSTAQSAVWISWRLRSGPLLWPSRPEWWSLAPGGPRGVNGLLPARRCGTRSRRARLKHRPPSTRGDFSYNPCAGSSAEAAEPLDDNRPNIITGTTEVLKLPQVLEYCPDIGDCGAMTCAREGPRRGNPSLREELRPDESLNVPTVAQHQELPITGLLIAF
jgi:hypothetical protein